MPSQRARSTTRCCLLLAALAAAPLGACQDSRGEIGWTPPRVAAEPQVEATEFRHEVLFTPGGSMLSAASEASLRQFVMQVATARDDQIFVLASPAQLGDPAGQGLLSQRRQAAVIRSLAGLGITSRAALVGSEALEPQAVAVIVRRTVVSLPACPDWTEELGANADNRPLRGWSCATAVNFGMMVADPNDLIRGRDPGNADGEYLARSVEQYRKGRTRDLIRDAASGDVFPSAAPTNNSGK